MVYLYTHCNAMHGAYNVKLINTIIFRVHFQDEICCIDKVKQAVNLQPGVSNASLLPNSLRITIVHYVRCSGLRIWHTTCQMSNGHMLRKYKQNPTNWSGATLTWLRVRVCLCKHSLTHVIHCIFSSVHVMFVDLWTTRLLLSSFLRSKLVKSRCQVKFSSSGDSAGLWTCRS